MENKWSVAMMVFILVVMAATGGEAINHICTFKCAILCHDIEFKTPCFRLCMSGCIRKTTSILHSTKPNSRYIYLSVFVTVYYMHVCTCSEINIVSMVIKCRMTTGEVEEMRGKRQFMMVFFFLFWSTCNRKI